MPLDSAKQPLSRATVSGGIFLSTLTSEGRIEIRLHLETTSGLAATGSAIRFDPKDAGRMQRFFGATIAKARKAGLGVSRSRHSPRRFSMFDAIQEVARKPKEGNTNGS